MGKMQNALIVTAILDLAMFLFYNNITQTSLLSWILNPSHFTSGNFFSIWNLNLFTALGAFTIIVGLYFIRNDFILYVAIAAVLVTFGATIYEFWNWIQVSIAPLNTLTTDSTSSIVASIVVLPLLIYYIFSVSDFARGRD